MLFGAILLSAIVLLDPHSATDGQTSASATAVTREQLAERFVNAASPERAPSLDPASDFMAELLTKANPGREADVMRATRAMSECRTRDGNEWMRQAQIEAALAFDIERLERLISYVEMRKAQQAESTSNSAPPAWEAARQDYGRWMYSIAVQPSAVAMAQRCSEEMATIMATAGLRYPTP